MVVVFGMDLFHYSQRSTFMLLGGLCTMAGYIILLSSRTIGVMYFACFLVATGIYILTGLNITWIGGNTKGRYKRAVAIGMNQTLGNAGGVLAGQIYIASEVPRYVTGQAVSLSMICMAIVGTLAMYTLLRVWNNQKAKKRAAGVSEDEPVEGSKFLGDKSVHFKYML